MEKKMKEKVNSSGKEANSSKRRKIDDHDGTPIGQGATIAIVAGKLEIEHTNLLENGSDNSLKQGIFKSNNTYPVLLRVSHTTAAGMEAVRFAMKVMLPPSQCFSDNSGKPVCEANLHFTESQNIFPIRDNAGLNVFVNMNVKAILGNLSALTVMATTANKMSNNAKTNETQNLLIHQRDF